MTYLNSVSAYSISDTKATVRSSLESHYRFLMVVLDRKVAGASSSGLGINSKSKMLLLHTSDRNKLNTFSNQTYIWKMSERLKVGPKNMVIMVSELVSAQPRLHSLMPGTCSSSQLLKFNLSRNPANHNLYIYYSRADSSSWKGSMGTGSSSSRTTKSPIFHHKSKPKSTLSIG